MVHHSILRSFQTSPKKKDQSHPWRHPRTNGHEERFMQTLNKAAQIAHLQGRTGFERNKAICDMLWRIDTHSTLLPELRHVWQCPTNQSDASLNTIIRLKRTKQQEMMDRTDMLYKDKMTCSGFNIKEHNFMLGYYVRLKRKKSKWSLAYTNHFSTRLSMSVALLPLQDE